SVLGLADTPATRTFASGSDLELPVNLAAASRPTPLVRGNQTEVGATPEAPERSDLLSSSKDRDFILRNFKTVYVDARGARYFGSDQLKAALGGNGDFAKLDIRMVDDRKVADVVLEVGYTFAWDFPFALKHQNTSIILLSGKGVGPFS